MSPKAAALGAIAVTLAVAAAPAASAAAEPPPAYDPKDLTGFWRMVEGPYESPEAYERAARLINPSLKVVPHTNPKDFPNGHPPLPIEFTPEFEALHQQLKAQYDAGHPYRTGQNCQPNGPWAMMVNNGPIEIFKDRDRFLIMRPPVHTQYVIYTARAHKTEFVLPELFGDSVGHWEGNTLVVDSINLGAHMVLTESDPHSQQLRVVQRLTRTAFDTLEDDVTAYDPRAFVHPLKAHLVWKFDAKGEFDESQCMGPTSQVPMKEAPE